MSPALIRFTKYGIVGSATFALDLCLLYILVDWFGLSYVLAAAVSFLFAVSINYVISRRFVFKQTLREVGEGYVHFILIALTGLLIVTGGMYLLVETFSVGYLMARLLVAVVTGFWNYLMNLYVNFKVAGKH